MEHKKLTSGLLIQTGSNKTIWPTNNETAWQMYGDKSCFRSILMGEILIMDDDFYEELPSHLKPMPCVTIVVIKGPHSLSIDDAKSSLITTGTFEQALEIAGKIGKKIFIAASPSLYMQAFLTKKHTIGEIVVMQIDRWCESPVQFDVSEEIWKETLLSLIRSDEREHLADVKFTHYQKTA